MHVILLLVCSSGTSGGKQKIFPINNKFFEDMTFIFALRSHIIFRHIKDVQEGKAITFFFVRPQPTTPSGLPVSNMLTSPDEVIINE
ncbi:hypothetical protein ARALYDRAFT_891408 [Arabidopsis lyrata subsp. lyrata]|uniref:Uncharacterized protein n=1 Tax=Arabidopsis lyrata subsp. lyrata TaxID=81972 RepID=D7KNU2_ARALL|nr:hypothetical protein ARALYDRAFT_891408 [Arabidopsis lyrata subsp. lyrata]